MTTPTAPSLPDMPRPPWRALALLTLAVALVHVVLLGLAPMGAGPKPSPLEARFSTRTIVIAPPAAETPMPVAAPPKVQAAPAPSPRPQRPRAVRPPRPAPAEPVAAPAPAPALDAAQSAVSPEPVADALLPLPSDAGVPDPLAAASAPASSSANASGGASGPTGTQAAGDVQRVTGPLSLRVPGSVRLKYDVSGQQGTSPMQGVYGEVDWLQDGNAYDARLSLGVLFRTLRTQHSSGVVGPTGIEPERFSDTRKTEVASHFVRSEGKVVFSNNVPSVPLLVGAQDRLSVVMQLGAMLAGDPARFPAGSTIAIQTVGPRDADIWTFNVGEEETLDLLYGPVKAIRVTRNPRREFDDKIEVWLAPGLDYLPVRLKQTQPNGDFADMRMRDHLPARPPS
ncbi:MAG: DUF3108 domain-containing protein [Comamonadaceae bacterium]|nr:MAG: DUF3108 domain-containing protein [Comamonadaceae bacterium]